MIGVLGFFCCRRLQEFVAFEGCWEAFFGFWGFLMREDSPLLGMVLQV